MADLLKIARRGPACAAFREIGGGTGGAYLRCDLVPAHPGPLHYDDYDGIWWFPDARDLRERRNSMMQETGHEQAAPAFVPHYTGLNGLELIDVIDEFNLNHYEAMIVSRTVRARRKNGLRDLYAAKYYLDRLIANVEKDQDKTRAALT